MDVATRKKYLSLLLISLTGFVLGSLAFHGAEAALLGSGGAGSDMHWGAKVTNWPRQTGKVQLRGNAFVKQAGETLTADEIQLDLNNRTVEAKGNCVYISSGMVMYGEEMVFNLDTRTGTIIAGRVSSDRYALSGDRINRLGMGRFQARNGTYTTCVDCPQAWTLFGKDVDIEFGGYASMSNVTAKIKDAPLFWMPYLIMPLKTERQTGFLFPRTEVRDSNFRFVLPFFWAISRSADLTLGLGYYGAQGLRTETDGRFIFSDNHRGNLKFYFLQDQLFSDRLAAVKQANPGARSDNMSLSPNRFSFSLDHEAILPWGIQEKFRFNEVSDDLYPSEIGDARGGDSVLTSDLNLFKTTQHFSFYGSLRRHRSLIQVGLDPRGADHSMVQNLPLLGVQAHQRPLLGDWLVGGLKFDYHHFTRAGGLYDLDPLAGHSSPVPGIDPLRKVGRLSLVPSVYTNWKPYESLTIVPSAEYRSYFYSFPGGIPGTQRGYLLFQTEATTQVERVYETSNVDIPRVRHLIRPSLTYSLIPVVNEPAPSSHPFFGQMDYAQRNNFQGYGFDSYDVTPLNASQAYSKYFVPLGNSITAELTTQLVRRRGAIGANSVSYDRFFELRTGETLNVRELLAGQGEQPFSTYFLDATLTFDSWGASFNYQYFPNLPIDERLGRTAFSSRAYMNLEKSVRQRIYTFDRSFTLDYHYNRLDTFSHAISTGIVYSINDFFMPSFSTGFDLALGRFNSLTGSFRFQSPAQCYAFGLTYGVARDAHSEMISTFKFDLSLNLTGNSFGGISELEGAVLKR